MISMMCTDNGIQTNTLIITFIIITVVVVLLLVSISTNTSFNHIIIINYTIVKTIMDSMMYSIINTIINTIMYSIINTIIYTIINSIILSIYIFPEQLPNSLISFHITMNIMMMVILDNSGINRIFNNILIFNFSQILLLTSAILL